MIDATPLIRAYAAARFAVLRRQDPLRTQERVLRGLLAHARGTDFGRAHGFDRIGSVGDFQARVPLRRYEDFWDQWWRAAFPVLENRTWPGRVPFFAQSSGTTSGRTKMIPVTWPMVRANRAAVLDMLGWHVSARPRSRVLGGRNFMLGGSTDLKQLAPGVLAGDLSGIAARTVPRWARPRYFPPLDLALEPDWDIKVAKLAAASLDADIRTISGTPSWLLLFLERLAAYHGGSVKLVDHYPNLELVVHGGVTFEPYRHAFERWLKDGHAETREVYPASEGFVALADRGPGEGLRMLLDRGIFFEFVPVEELDAAVPTRHWVGTVETGVNYALAISTNAGLWAYLLGDTVRLVDRDPPRLLVTGRTSYALSVFGEHLIGAEIEAAVMAAGAALAVEVSEFSVGAEIDPNGATGRHRYVVEIAGDPPEPARFAAAIDRDLTTRNMDYEEHRRGDIQLLAPRVDILPPGGFAEWMRRRGKLGGQHKVPRVISDHVLFRDLLDFAATVAKP